MDVYDVLHLSSAFTDYIVFCLIASDVDECKNNAGMKTSVCVNGQCQNTMKDYICVCNAGFRSDPTKKLCNGKNIINTAGMAKTKTKLPPVFVYTMRELQRVVCGAGQN